MNLSIVTGIRAPPLQRGHGVLGAGGVGAAAGAPESVHHMLAEAWRPLYHFVHLDGSPAPVHGAHGMGGSAPSGPPSPQSHPLLTKHMMTALPRSRHCTYVIHM